MRSIPFTWLALAAAFWAAGLLSPPEARAQGAAEKPTSAEPVVQQTPETQIPRQKWTYGGLFGYFDEQQLRRGYKLYHQVCSNCHNMKFMSYRNLGQPGGPHFPKEEVDAIAAEVQVADGFDEQGNPKMRAGKASDPFQWKFKNEAEARAALNGALPPDLSLMAKARTVEREFAWYAFPVIMLRDVLTQYQEQGSDYIYSLLTGYTDPPANFKMSDGLYYDKAYPGHQVAMPQPLAGGDMDYGDGTLNTLDQEAKDVTAFLAWAAEPHLMDRKKLGLWVLVYLGIVVALLLISKRTLWRNVEH